MGVASRYSPGAWMKGLAALLCGAEDALQEGGMLLNSTLRRRGDTVHSHLPQ
eukprot:CAMPEP_0179052298 /NCGR_PEP_ID=MMETSP0796-20121207/21686_1 /TAXON_ID=73915 /ORGANISM="Pyrodinium bahamense, Strain pbaha01" /LENGTH=51 /DNA_ID=CAMNT_0020748861 /DNA_START=1 /DNA_END=153 /DNA_ORIENTATION=+